MKSSAEKILKTEKSRIKTKTYINQYLNRKGSIALAECIYCGCKENFSDEHCLPAGLGEFVGHHILTDKICVTCNNKLSRLEVQFLRVGPEGLFRHYLKIDGRKRHKKRSPYYHWASGAPPLEIKLQNPETGIEMLWEIDQETGKLQEMNQIVFKFSSGEIFPIPVSEEIKSQEEFQKHIERAFEFAGFSLKEAEPIHITFDPEKNSSVEDWMRNLYKKKITFVERDPQKRKAKVKAAIKVQVTHLYFRAIAKIGFHYFLALHPELKGSEVCFTEIRNFILEGESDPDLFVKQVKGQIIHQLKDNVVPSVWGHVVTAEREENSMRSKLQFFVGPESTSPIYFLVELGKTPGRIIYTSHEGHFYRYYENGPKDGKVGVVDPLLS